MMVLFGTGAVAWWLAAEPSTSNIPVWPTYVFAGVAAVGLYFVLAPLLRWWPWTHSGDSQPLNRTHATSQQRRAPSVPRNQSKVLRRAAEPQPAPPKRLPPEPKNHERRRVPIRTETGLPLPPLADELSRFKERGVAIRRELKPPTGYATSSMSVLSQAMPVLAERSIRSWSAGVRLHLEKHAPRFLVLFDEGPDLPPPHMFSVVTTVNRQELLAFLDHKIVALDRIIRAIIERPVA